MKPVLDHFIGRAVTGVDAGPGKSNHWNVQLEGNVIVRNHDKDVPVPPNEILNTTLLSAVKNGDSMAVTFGRASEEGVATVAVVILTENKYTISAAGMETSPDEPEETLADAVPPDPSAERVVDGPASPQEATDAG